MTDDTGVVKPWTIALTGAFKWPEGGIGPAVVITEKGGGNVRLKKRGKIRWTNISDRSIRIAFEDWPDDGGTPDPVWPFSTHEGGQDVNTPPGSVTVAAGQSFEGQVAGIGRVLVKYTLSALTGGQVDVNVLPLDPMIVVER